MRAFVACGTDPDARALRRHRRQAAPLPLRRAGQLARAHRGAAENNVQRIVLEMLAVTLSKQTPGPRAVQLPAWNEALGLPRPWDQQWSLRIQQVLAFESDLLEYDDLFGRSVVVEAKVADLVEKARAEIGAIGRWRRRSPPSRPAT